MLYSFHILSKVPSSRVSRPSFARAPNQNAVNGQSENTHPPPVSAGRGGKKVQQVAPPPVVDDLGPEAPGKANFNLIMIPNHKQSQFYRGF